MSTPEHSRELQWHIAIGTVLGHPIEIGIGAFISY
jgi:hypothetical protein